MPADMKATATKQPRTKPFIVFVACAAALGGLIFGYDIAGAGGTFAMNGFKEHFGWIDSNGTQVTSDSTQALDKGMINAFFGIGAFLGALANSFIADRFGRRPCLVSSTVTFIIGATIQMISPSMGVMWAGRFVAGIGIGMLSMCVPVYISECAPEHARGAMSTLWQLATTLGILIASVANIGLKDVSWGWRLSYGGNTLFALLLLLCTVFMPESPRWLGAKGRTEELKAALLKVRFEEEVAAEVEQIETEVAEELDLGTSTWSEVLCSNENSMRYRLLVGCGLQMFQQLSGINAVMFYAPDIFSTFFSEEAALYGTIGINFANFIATFIAVYAVDRCGRVSLLMIGGLSMCSMLAVLCVLSALQESGDSGQGLGVAVICFCVIFVVSFAYSWGPVVWVVCSELFPLRARGKANAMSTATNWVFTTIIGAVFPSAQQGSLAACFGFFAVVIGVGVAIVYFYLPETANLSILQIDTIVHHFQPKLARPGLCCTCSASGKDDADALPLVEPSVVPASQYDRASHRTTFRESLTEEPSQKYGTFATEHP